MPNLFTCFSASRSKPHISTNTSSDTAGVEKRWAALPPKDVQALSDPEFVDVLKSAADHIDGNPRTARHVMDCLQGKRAPDDADTWLQDKNLDHDQKRICAALFRANRYGHTESADKSRSKIAYLLERLSEQRPTETPSVIEHVPPEKTAPGIDEMIADMVAESQVQVEKVRDKVMRVAKHKGSNFDEDKLSSHIRPFLEIRWRAVLDACLAGDSEDILQRLQALKLVPVTSMPANYRVYWQRICFDALVVAIKHHKDDPMIQPLLDRVQDNICELDSQQDYALREWMRTRLVELGRTDRETFPLLSHAAFQKTHSMQALQQRLDGFLAAQDQTAPRDSSQTQWDQMLCEAKKAPAKDAHYMWYAYPQLRFNKEEIGVEPTWIAQQFGIEDVYEAMAYLEHPILGDRLRTLCRHLLRRTDLTAQDFFRHDTCKFQSCLTLFALATQEFRIRFSHSIDTEHAALDKARWDEDEALFLDCLGRFFDGEADKKTETRLGRTLQKTSETRP